MIETYNRCNNRILYTSHAAFYVYGLRALIVEGVYNLSGLIVNNPNTTWYVIV